MTSKQRRTNVGATSLGHNDVGTTLFSGRVPAVTVVYLESFFSSDCLSER